ARGLRIGARSRQPALARELPPRAIRAIRFFSRRSPMKASVRWLRELCPSLPDDAAAIAARLTSAGLEVEGTHAYGLGAEACVVATGVSSRPHPPPSGLGPVTGGRGGGGQEIVCGRPTFPNRAASSFSPRSACIC